MLRSEYWSEVVWISTGVATISLFAVQIPTSSKEIRLGSKFPRAKTDDHIEATKELPPMDLAACKEVNCGKIFQIFVVRNYIYGQMYTFEVMLPDLESFENGEEFLVMSVVVEFRIMK